MIEAAKYIGRTVEVIIDRPRGFKHPKFRFEYPVNYGYIPGTMAGDGEELDAYVLGVEQALDKFIGKCIAIIHRKNDNEDKLIVVPDEMTLSDDEIRRMTEFQERFFETKIIRS
jgi:inorganic pyrophosphatase